MWAATPKVVLAAMPGAQGPSGHLSYLAGKAAGVQALRLGRSWGKRVSGLEPLSPKARARSKPEREYFPVERSVRAQRFTDRCGASRMIEAR